MVAQFSNFNSTIFFIELEMCIDGLKRVCMSQVFRSAILVDSALHRVKLIVDRVQVDSRLTFAVVVAL